jgi:hypothetical protein
MIIGLTVPPGPYILPVISGIFSPLTVYIEDGNKLYISILFGELFQ